jgi:hypothetical protein
MSMSDAQSASPLQLRSLVTSYCFLATNLALVVIERGDSAGLAACSKCEVVGRALAGVVDLSPPSAALDLCNEPYQRTSGARANVYAY